MGQQVHGKPPSVEFLASGMGLAFICPIPAHTPAPASTHPYRAGGGLPYGVMGLITPRPGEIPVSWDAFSPSCALEAQASDSVVQFPTLALT